MGKNLIQQARGKGGPRYRAPSFNYKGAALYAKATQDLLVGKVRDIVHCAGHSGPLVEVEYNDGQLALLQAAEEMHVGMQVAMGADAEVKTGNVLPLRNIPEGTLIFNIESVPGDGGKFVRTSGGCAKIVMKMPDRIIVQLPSSKNRDFIPGCRATIGIIAGSGRKEKPFLKAGTKFHAMKVKNKLWPKVCGISMNAVDHPFGGKGSHTKGRPTQAPRNAPPGRKVGKIAPKRTGRNKR